MGDCERREEVDESREGRRAKSVPPPAPRKPRPPARETAWARGAPEMRRMGAETRRGVVVQG